MTKPAVKWHHYTRYFVGIRLVNLSQERWSNLGPASEVIPSYFENTLGLVKSNVAGGVWIALYTRNFEVHRINAGLIEQRQHIAMIASKSSSPSRTRGHILPSPNFRPSPLASLGTPHIRRQRRMQFTLLAPHYLQSVQSQSALHFIHGLDTKQSQLKMIKVIERVESSAGRSH